MAEMTGAEFRAQFERALDRLSLREASRRLARAAAALLDDGWLEGNANEDAMLEHFQDLRDALDDFREIDQRVPDGVRQ